MVLSPAPSPKDKRVLAANDPLAANTLVGSSTGNIHCREENEIIAQPNSQFQP